MRYQEYLPHPSLRPYIVNYWQIVMEPSGFPAPVEQILPDGNASLMFTSNSIRRSFDGEPEGIDLSGRAVFVGQKRKAIQYTFPTDNQVVTWGVRFHPSGVRAFTDLPMHECTDLVMDATDVFSSAVQELMDRIMDQPFSRTILPAMDQFFLSRFRSHQTPLLITTEMASILQRDQHSIQRLAETFRMSTRQVERYFKTYVGLTPKNFSCIARFNLAVLEANPYPDISLAAISHASGYFNTIHLQRETMKICGQRPQVVFEAKQSQMRPLFMHILRQRLAS